MSIFSKPISQLDTDDLKALLDDGAVEGVRLEFKREVPNKDETLKKLSSFANTFGGFLVVGAEEDGKEGRLQALPGVEPQNGYRQRVVDWSFAGVSPPLTAEVSDPIPAPGSPDRFCYVLYVAESDLAPHFLNGRKGVYVRTDEFSARFESRLADERDLRLLLDRRKLVRERRAHLLGRARKRFETYLRKRHAEIVEAEDVDGETIGARFHLCVGPRFPARRLCGLDDVNPKLLKNRIPWRQVDFPRGLDFASIITQQDSAVILNAANQFSIIEANIWGMVYYGAEIEGIGEGAREVNLYQFVGHLLVYLQHAGRFLKAMGYSGPVFVNAALHAIRDVVWIYPGRFEDILPKNNLDDASRWNLDDEIEFSIQTTSECLRRSPDEVAVDVLREVLFSVNLSRLVPSEEKVVELIQYGYKFNFWPWPPKTQDEGSPA